MILQALAEYYERKRRYAPASLPPPGYQITGITWVVVLHPNGEPVAIEHWLDERIIVGKNGKEKRVQFPRQVKTPLAVDRPGQGAWQTAFLLWDHPRYVFGIPKDGSAKEAELAPKRLRAFVERIEQSFPATELVEPEISAVLLFYRKGGIEKLHQMENWAEASTGGGNVSFMLAGQTDLVCQLPAVQAVAARALGSEQAGDAICLVTGETAKPAPLHIATPIRKSPQATAKLVSYNEKAFCSFGKEQGANAPVSPKAVFAYATALNDLLTKSLVIGDAEVLFWAEKPGSPFVDVFGGIMSDDPDTGKGAIQSLFSSLHNGAYVGADANFSFHVLGLSPNIARLSVRFFHRAQIREFAERIGSYFGELHICAPSLEQGYPSLYSLMCSLAAQGEAKNVAPNLAGEWLRAVLEDLPLPLAALHSALRRWKTDRQLASEKSPSFFIGRQYHRAAVIKAVLNRQIRKGISQEEPITMSLNPDDPRPAYRLGRLFATLEKIQTHGNRDLNTTIRERYYGAASASPASVFPVLMRLKNHHLAKLEGGTKVFYEKLLGEIVSGLDDFSPQLNLREQGLFAIGYYHQTQAFYTRKSEN